MNFQRYQALISAELETLNKNKEPQNLYEPIRYILEIGGKRIRPVLCLMAAELYASTPEVALKQAAAVEVFHNFTLMHDDIMDKANLRRGKATVHQKWNEPIAILAGDVMLVQAFQYLLDTSFANPKLLFDIFSKVSIEICEGQQMDMDFEERSDVQLAEYLEMIKLKTAVLLGVSLQLGALVGGASTQDAEKLYEFGINTGLAFQIKDDLLDAFGDPKNVGKKVGGDILANKKTYLWLAAYNNADTDKKEVLNEQLANQDADSKLAKTLALFQELGAKEQAEKAIETYYKKSMDNLGALSLSEAESKPLKQMAAFLLGRTH